MNPTTKTEFLTCAETAKIVRRALKRDFPGVRFSVRSNNYAGGASINVKWTDGPTTSEVAATNRDYEGARFDGMIDLAYQAAHWLTDDGIATVQRISGHPHDSETVTPDRPAGAVLVHFGADYIFEERHESPELVARCAELAELVNDPVDVECSYCRRPGGQWLARHGNDVRYFCSAECAGQVIARDVQG